MSNINKLDVTKALPDYYLPYAQYVNQTRALPDARDCLKTGTRFILYAQYLEKLTYDKPRRKAVATVNAAMNFSVHGDAAIYGTAVRMSQPFALRYPLIEVKGNNGSQINGDDYAAARYLEMRSNKLAFEMTSLLKKETIDKWELNYTQEKKYPTVLPSLFPNFVNGATGIGVGMACSIPQFNLREVADKAIYFLENPNASESDLYCPIDFCTGGIIINEEQVKQSLMSGNGKAAVVRAKIEFDATHKELVVTQLPYQVTSSQVVAQIQKCIEEQKIAGIEAVFDGSDFDGIRICIKLSKAVNTEKIVKQLYKETSLQSHFGINMMMLKNGVYPRLFSFKQMMEEYLAHMQSVLRKSFEYDLREAKDRLEILEGYLKALGSIDEIVSIIKKSESKELAISGLCKTFEFSRRQAEAILELKLQRLVNLEYIKLKKEFDDLTKEVKYLIFVLEDAIEFRSQVIKHIKRIADEYGDARRTTNITLGIKTDTEEVIDEKNLVLYFTNHGNIYADETTTLISQRKGGRGSKIKLNDGEVIIKTISGKNTSSLLAFSNKGRAFTIPFEDLLSSTNTNNLLQLESDENIIEITMSDKTKHIVFITKNGLLKKSLTEIYNIKQKGVAAVKLVDNDILLKVLFVNDEKIALLTKRGLFKIIDSSTINPIGRIAQGVICIKLDSGDFLVDAQIIEKDSKEIISITEDGLATRVSLDDFETTGRTAKGKQLQKGELVGFVLISFEDKEIAISSSKNIIKIPINSVTLVNRNSIGTRAIALKDSIITGVIKEL